MKKYMLWLGMAFLVWACQPAQAPEQTSTEIQEVKDGVFIHISAGSENPHRLLMALGMANKMADDKDVLVYMDIEAVKVLVKDAGPVAMEPFGDHITLIQNLLSQGIGVLACPTCLEVAGIDPENLMEGVQIASKEKFFGFTEGRILSLDY
ncbi:MAG TPA: DsrE family protein [Bacteroidales bacterium]|mgnify:FL=1|nr:DsrE family protein [Bacteroidales bacterium]